MLGIIPAAGLGSRMGELGKATPKALLEVEGVKLLDHSFQALEAFGIKRAVVVVGHLEAQIRNHVTNTSTNLEVTFEKQEVPLGLAHAIAVAAPHITEDFVVLCPDNIYTDPTDLIAARDHFLTHNPAFLLVATAEPSQQRDRRSYKIAAHENPDANLFGYRPRSDVETGVEIFSTGCVFFRRDAVNFLPSFAEGSEHKFPAYLDVISKNSPSLIYLMKGMRYDFSNWEDVKVYEELRSRLRNSVGKGVSAILINEAGQVLLQQRDDNPAIRYPGHWALFGGSMENGESAFDAVIREVQEEICFDLKNVGLFRQFVQNNKREFAFVGEITAGLDELQLSEGQGMGFFSPSQLPELLIRPDDKETLESYFGAKHDR